MSWLFCLLQMQQRQYSWAWLKMGWWCKPFWERTTDSAESSQNT